ncbi:MAG TPA: redoxin domain-containing protein [Solirubrobacteraceae bacterium]|nr:redoxin domain-containing protein [Solirubrobacteraceae bacterium]
MSTSEQRPPKRTTPRYGGYVGLLALLILALITINTIVTKPNGVKGLASGEQVPAFAVPLALSSLEGDADTATHANEGAAGRVPACQERGPRILNVCQLYEGAPVVLALFVNGGSCTDVLDEMQALAPSFPGVRFAGVALKGDRDKLRRLIRSRGLTFPLGIDNDGALAALYKVGTCPQLTFIYPGGEVQGRALLNNPSRGQLHRRVDELAAGARGRGWRGAGFGR